ncbi:hypothetical protein CRYUN_Cryun17cG0072600 [Craigia yunnanensis]
MGFTRVLVEGDALNIVSRINQVTPDLFSIGHLVEVAKFLMRGFQLCKMQYARREANNVAHALAKATLNFGEDLYWVDKCPDSVMALVATHYNACFS